MSEPTFFPSDTEYTVAELGALQHGYGGDAYPNIVAAMTKINSMARIGIMELATAGHSDHLLAGNLAVIAHINKIIGMFLNDPKTKISMGDACVVMNVVLEVDSDQSPTITTLVVAPTTMLDTFVKSSFAHVPPAPVED